MRLPKRPFIYIRRQGELLFSAGPGKAGADDMRPIVNLVDAFCQSQFWGPDTFDPSIPEPDRRSSNQMQSKPSGRAIMLWNGERCTIWTGMSDAQLLDVSRYTAKLVAGEEKETEVVKKS